MSDPVIDPAAAAAAKQDPPKQDPPAQDPPKTDPPKQDPPKTDPPKQDPPKVDPPKQDPPKTDPPKKDEPKSDERVAAAEKQLDDSRFQTSVLKAAMKSAVKDPDYFEFLIGKERSEKGKDFNLDAAVESLKKAKPEIFATTAAAESKPAGTTAAGAPPAQANVAADKLKADYAEAQKKGDTLGMLRIKTDAAKAGITL